MDNTIVPIIPTINPTGQTIIAKRKKTGSSFKPILCQKSWPKK